MAKQMDMVDIRAFGGWEKAYKDHFAEGALYDQISKK